MVMGVFERTVKVLEVEVVAIAIAIATDAVASHWM